MRVSVKWLRELVDLPSQLTTQQIADGLTMAGLEVEGISPLTAADVGIEDPSFQDEALEINVTPNRPDALCHMGIARELGAVFGARTRFNTYSPSELGPNIHDAAQVTIAAKESCLRYACRVIDNIRVEKSSPVIQARLMACGIRPVNNIVDITNLVMLERGQPLHAFDWDRLGKERGRANLAVRFAQEGEKLVTLDKVDRTLSSNDLVIADPHGPVALAGVMGGLDSEVTEKTTSILLESAYFVPQVIRQNARRHSMSTDASYRFERGCDPNSVLAALDEAADMMMRLLGGRVRRESIDLYPEKVEPLEVTLRKSRLVQLSGLPEAAVDEAVVRNIFLSLGMEAMGKRGDALVFRVPTFRPDIVREVDLIEEALRLIGYDRIPERILFSKRLVGNENQSHLNMVTAKTRSALAACGFDEAINYAFGSKANYALCPQEEAHEAIELQNPMGEELSVLRQSLLPGLIDNLALNIRKGAKDVRLFEIGNVFYGLRKEGQQPTPQSLSGLGTQDAYALEVSHIAGLMTGSDAILGYDVKNKALDFWDLKGVLESVLCALQLEESAEAQPVRFVAATQPPAHFHPGMCAQMQTVNGDLIGYLGALHPDVKVTKDLQTEVFAFEIKADKLAGIAPKQTLYHALPKYPAVQRDLALLVDDALEAGAVVNHLTQHEALRGKLESVRIFDVYKGQGIAEGKKSLAVALLLRSQDRTLTDVEVAEAMASVVQSLQQDLQASIR